MVDSHKSIANGRFQLQPLIPFVLVPCDRKNIMSTKFLIVLKSFIPGDRQPAWHEIFLNYPEHGLGEDFRLLFDP